MAGGQHGTGAPAPESARMCLIKSPSESAARTNGAEQQEQQQVAAEDEIPKEHPAMINTKTISIMTKPHRSQLAPEVTELSDWACHKLLQSSLLGARAPC